ncbi:hypothetical protein BV898_07656 [Hypsibius exemplaris]|uniref:Uncharacterized protein n=1 Tax=Hypsibius exemplaris TaxID=2072580 RepID=A0A1W0WSU8_HYPEX|nr:hypothetical protein BV898_07656 [Hypsibius exemplaris]
MPIVDPYRLKAARIKRIYGTPIYGQSIRHPIYLTGGALLLGYVTWYFTYRNPAVLARQIARWDKFANALLPDPETTLPMEPELSPKLKMIKQWELEEAAALTPSPAVSKVAALLCPCCCKIKLLPTELEVHAQSCGLILEKTTTASVSQLSGSTYSSSMSSTFSSTLGGGKRTRQKCITMRALKKMDEETQVALALSASMEPSTDITRTKRAAAKSTKTKIKFTAPPPILIERDPKDSKKIVSDRVAALVGRCRTGTAIPAGSLPESSLQQRRIAETGEKDGQLPDSMWTLSEKLLLLDLSAFYVASLVPPITPCLESSQGHFPSLSQIPGFKLTPLAPPSKLLGFHSEIPFDEPESSTRDTDRDPPPTECLEATPMLSKIELACPTAVAEYTAVSDVREELPGTGQILPEDEALSDDDNEDARTLILFSSSEDSDLEM